MALMSPARSVDATEPPPTPPTTGRTRWTTHLGRFAIALLVVLAATSIVARIRQDPAAGTDAAVPRAVAPTPSLQESVAKLEARSTAAPDDASNWQQLGTAYVQRSIQTLDTSYYDL